jgi:hypothetical protein
MKEDGMIAVLQTPVQRKLVSSLSDWQLKWLRFSEDFLCLSTKIA